MTSPTDLRAYELFAHLAPHDVQALQQHATRHVFPGGHVLFQAGDPVLGLYLVESGCFKLYKLSTNGQEQVLALLQAGHTLAEWAIFQGDRYPVSAQCVAEGGVVFIDRQCLMTQMEQTPALALSLLTAISTKLRRFLHLIEDLTLRDAQGRLSRYLAALTDSRLADPQDISLPVSQVTLARLLGMTSETLSRALRHLRDDHIVEPMGRQRLRIHDTGRLRHAAGEFTAIL